MLPVLIFLDQGLGARRHSHRNQAELVRAFNSAWRTYRETKCTPFKKNYLDSRSATTEQHIIDKCLGAVESDESLIYIYGSIRGDGRRKRPVLRLSGRRGLDVCVLLDAIHRRARRATVVILDVVELDIADCARRYDRIAIVCRSGRDFVQPDSFGCDPLTGAFARYFGTAFRHLPMFTVREIVQSASDESSAEPTAGGSGFKWLGREEPLDVPLLRSAIIPGEITESEVQNLSSENVGSFEDGLQAIWEATGKPGLSQDAKDLATLFVRSFRFQRLHSAARAILERGHPSSFSSITSHPPSRALLIHLLNDLVEIPEGTALIGSDPSVDRFALEQEIPLHEVVHEQFAIGCHQVTVGVWKEYRRAFGEEIPTSGDNSLKHPITQVSFFDALHFLSWVEDGAKRLSLIEPDSRLVLPSEAEWEIAARGRDGRLYPWGNEFHPWCNFRENSGDRLVPIGSFSPRGDSPFGITDMAGNAWDWTRSLWGKGGRQPEFRYPYRANDGRENLGAGTDVRRVVRGGAYYYFDWCLRCATRNVMFPETRHSGGSFRVAKVIRYGSDIRPIKG
jgi:formylglycine-generating enzyme required for sulfatase activity